METMKEKAEDNISTIDASKSNNETKHIKALENLQKELNNVNNELKKWQEQHIKMKKENAAKMQEIELKLTEKEQEISDANKNLLEKSTCLTITEQDLKSVRQEKINLEEELETLRYLITIVYIFYVGPNDKDSQKEFDVSSVSQLSSVKLQGTVILKQIIQNYLFFFI